jgi:hypothetical protein
MLPIKTLAAFEKVFSKLNNNIHHFRLLANLELGHFSAGINCDSSKEEMLIAADFLETYSEYELADLEYAEYFYNHTCHSLEFLTFGENLDAQHEEKFHALYGNKLFGSQISGENRGAKHQRCQPGNRLCGTRCIKIGEKCKYDVIHKTIEAQKFAIRDSISMGVLMPKELRNKLVNEYPNIFSNPKFERFFWHQMYSSNTTETQSVVVPQDVIREFAGSSYPDFNKFLTDFQIAAGGPEKFEIAEHSYAWKKAREVKLHMRPYLRRIVKDDLKEPNFVKLNRKTGEQKELVFALGGFDHTPALQERIRGIQQAAAIEVANSLTNPDQKMIALYHAHQRADQMPKYHWPEAYAAAASIREEDSQLTALRMLNNIESNPVGYYRPSKITTRLFVANHLQGLKSSVRASLLPDMVEVDLVSSFAHVLGSLTQNESLKDVLHESEHNKKYKGKIWGIYQEDIENAGFEWDDNIKKLVKVQHCALGYGGEKGGCTMRINEFARENPRYQHLFNNKKFREALYNSRAFKAIDEAGTQFRKNLIADGYGTNAYGRKLPVPDKSTSRSVMSAIMHSYETALVAGCGYDYKPEERSFDTIYFGHDGFGIVPKPGKTVGEVQKQINDKVKFVRQTLTPPISTAIFEVKSGKAAAEDEDIDWELLEKNMAKYLKK